MLVAFAAIKASIEMGSGEVCTSRVRGAECGRPSEYAAEMGNISAAVMVCEAEHLRSRGHDIPASGELHYPIIKKA